MIAASVSNAQDDVAWHERQGGGGGGGLVVCWLWYKGNAQIFPQQHVHEAMKQRRQMAPFQLQPQQIYKKALTATDHPRQTLRCWWSVLPKFQTQPQFQIHHAPFSRELCYPSRVPLSSSGQPPLREIEDHIPQSPVHMLICTASTFPLGNNCSKNSALTCRILVKTIDSPSKSTF